MRGTLAIYTRELAARREVLWLAAALALLAVAMPLLPGLQGQGPEEIVSVTSGAVAFLVGLLLAAAFGVGLIGRDLSEGRLGFYFARPVSEIAIWSAKVAAAITLILTCELVAGLPALLVELPRAGDSEDLWIPAVLYTGVPVLLLLLVHALGVMVRARTAWLVLDLIGAVVVALVAWVTLRPLVELEAATAVVVVAGALGSCLLVALLVAGAVQLARGRTDLARSHRALSLALWSVLACGTAGAAGYGWWLRSFTVHDLELEGYPHVSPDGRWMVLTGTASGRLDVVRAFLCSVDGQRQVALPSRARWDLPTVTFADDGRSAIWFEGEGDRSTLVFVDLSVADPRAEATTVVVSRTSGLALAPDARRLAELADGLLSVASLPDGRLETSIRTPPDLRSARLEWVDEDRLGLSAWLTTDEGTEVIRHALVDLPSGRLQRLADRPQSDWRWSGIDPGRELGVQVQRDASGELIRQNLCDLETGRVLRALDPRVDGVFEAILADGRVLGVQRMSTATARLVVSSIDGAAREGYEVPWSEGTRLHGELRPGLQLMVTPVESWEDNRFEVLDLATGSRRLVGEGLGWYSRDLSDRGSVARLLVMRGSTLLVWDELSGELTPFAPWLRG